ncbi:MAG: hypothetical protein OES35_14185 [Chromatiales bacterium]|nr:hypothetical protein [Chromatiales bacterium]
MRKRPMLGLCLGVSMALSVVTAQADPGNGKAKGHSMQIQIDKKTGKKITPDDSAPLPAAATTTTTAAASGLMPLESSGPRQHADGSVSAQLGLRQMKFVTMSIDENGNREVEHQTLESFEATTQESTANEGEK